MSGTHGVELTSCIDLPLRLGIIGCGDIARVHGKAALEKAQKVRFVACCDVRSEAAASWARLFGCDKFYTDYEEMVESEELNGILIATWPNQHKEQVIRCLDLGIRNILCEKALTLRGMDATEIWERVTSVGAFLMEGFMYRHHPAIRKLKDLVSSGEIGTVDYARAVFNNGYDPELVPPDDPNRNWRQRKECGGGVPYDTVCYAVNGCGHFVEQPAERVMATGGIGKYGTINRLYGIIEYARGGTGIVASSKKADFDEELEIAGAQGILRLPVAWTRPGEFAIEKTHLKGWFNLQRDTFETQDANPYVLQLENFADTILGLAEPCVPLIESVANTFTTEALVTSLLEKRSVKIRMPESIIQALSTHWSKPGPCGG